MIDPLPQVPSHFIRSDILFVLHLVIVHETCLHFISVDLLKNQTLIFLGR